MTKKRKRLLALLMVCLLSICFNTAVFAAEAKNSNISDFEIISTSSDNEYPLVTANENIKSFQGEYSSTIDIPFTVTDSSRPVRVLYAIRYADGSTADMSIGVRNSSSSVWFWTQFNLIGGSQIKEIGRLQPGTYYLRIIPNHSGTYAISGQIYYY